MDFGKVLDTLMTFFEREGFQCAAIGAFGLHAYGLSRATLDLDLATEDAAQPRLIAFLESGTRRSTDRRAIPTIFTHSLTSGGSISCT